MEKFHHIVRILVSLVAVAYVALIFALDQPGVQRFMADKVEEQLEEVFASQVDIDHISVGLFNAVELRGVTLYDKNHKVLLQSKVIYGKVSIAPLLKGKIYLRNISVLDGSFNLYKETQDSELNCKFVFDAFKTDDKEKKPLDLTINSLLLRRCQMVYDEKYVPYPADSRFTPHHLFLRDVNANLSLKHLTNDEISLRVRHLSLAEQSGLNIEELRLRLQADRKHADIEDLVLRMPNSGITQKHLAVDYDMSQPKQLLKTLALSERFDDISISTKDLKAFIPTLQTIDETLYVQTQLIYANSQVSLQTLSLSNAAHTVDFVGDVDYRNNGTNKFGIEAQVKRLFVQQGLLASVFANALNKQEPAEVYALGNIEFEGGVNYLCDRNLSGLAANKADVTGKLTTALGTLNTDVKLENNHIGASIASDAFKPSILKEGRFVPSFIDFKAVANTDLSASGMGPAIGNLRLGNTDADVSVNTVTIANQTYRNIHAIVNYAHPSVKIHVDADDDAAKLQADLTTELAKANPFGTLPAEIGFDLGIAHINPAQLHITNHFGQGTIAMKAAGKLSSLSFENLDNLSGEAYVEDFCLMGDRDNTTPFHISNFNVTAQPTVNGNHIMLRSDFVDLDYSGPIQPQRVKQVVQNVYNNVQQGVFNEDKSASEMSMSNSYPSDNRAGGLDNKNISFILSLKDAEFLNRLLGVKANYRGTIHAQGSASNDGNHLSMSCLAPSLSFGKFDVSDVSLYVRSEEGSFNVLGKGRKQMANGDIKLELTAINRDGQIYTDVEWDESLKHAFYGKLSAVSRIDLPSSANSPSSTSTPSSAIDLHHETTLIDLEKQPSGKHGFGISTEFTPSMVCIGDSLWQFSRSRLDYRDSRLNIENFGVHNATQSLAINGTYDKNFSDAITADLHNIDLDYVLAFARLNVVEFSGHASGKIYVKALPNGDPWAKAVVNVPDLQFNHTPFGNADVELGWNHAEKDITIEGHIVEPGIGFTDVEGYVDPVNRNLDLQTLSKNTQLGFLNKYTEGIFENISGRTSGNCRIYGGFQTIEFFGHERANAEATIPVTGVTYVVKEAEVDIISDAFILQSAMIADKYVGEGTATGMLQHKYIKDMNYDFTLEGKNLRLYDKPRELDMPFYSTATGSGEVHIDGRPGIMNTKARITTTPGSEMTYIIDSPDADVSQLITFHDATPADSDSITTLRPILPIEKQMAEGNTVQIPSTTATQNNGTTDINLEFEVDVDAGSCLHLITDDKSGDVITVYGSGPIQANYHNKSGFTMFGTYNIDRGSYNLNIPSLAQRRKFEILSGGRVNFSGDPSNAEVQVKAQYVVNSASLADLNIGTGFANNTTRVNCIADIYGEVANMQFNLGLELPNCSEDEQQMVNNLIASDEDRTMQVLYLLGVGRFYAYNYTAADISQSQSVLMMNSLLSSTLSSQLNNIISDAVGSSNWTFGTNISTGQLGWSDMEVEGLVSSRLLNNRLIINGNFGYSERQAATTNFVGDFDMQYLITPKGTVSVKAYSETNDRYFTKSTLTTQGVGIQLKKDFTKFANLFRRKRNRQKSSQNNIHEK